MAGLTQAPLEREPGRWTAAQSRAQFAALAQLRWCLFRNGFRRKGGVGELVARILFLPLLGILVVGPILAAGLAGREIVSSRRYSLLPVLTWGIFVLWQLVSINISAPGLSFDINTIIRFPISFSRYLTARLFFGLLSASTVIGTLALLSTDVGIGMAHPSLLPWATLLLTVFGLANIFFTRMIFAWVDRWLSTRRAREVLTAVIVFASLGFQYLNVTFNPGLRSGHASHAHQEALLLKAFHGVQPIAALLPPGLAAAAIVSFAEQNVTSAAGSLAGLSAFAALFLAIFAWRMAREFRGENLSEVQSIDKLSADAPRRFVRGDRVSRNAAPPGTLRLNPVLAACLQKELLSLRRNTNQLYGLIGPVVMVFLFAGRIGGSGHMGEFVLPASVAYAVLGASILSYNGLGMDGAGVQFYFLAPVRMRDVFLAKNFMALLLNGIAFVLIVFVLSATGRPPSALIIAATACWLLFATFLNAAAANRRSLTAPRKIDFSRLSRKQTSQLSALIAVAVVAGCGIAGAAVVLLADFLHRPWLMMPLLLALCFGSFLVYRHGLERLDNVALDHRDTLIAELGKT